MTKLFTLLLGANPIYLLLGLLAYSSLLFGSGWYFATNHALKIASAAPIKAAAAQHKADVKAEDVAGKISADVKADHEKTNAKLNSILAQLNAQPKLGKNCIVPKDTIKLLNEAGE